MCVCVCMKGGQEKGRVKRLGWQYNCIGSKATRAVATTTITIEWWCSGGGGAKSTTLANSILLSGVQACSSSHLYPPRPPLPHDAFKKLRPPPRRCIHFIQSHANKCNLHIFQIILSGTPSPNVRACVRVYLCCVCVYSVHTLIYYTFSIHWASVYHVYKCTTTSATTISKTGCVHLHTRELCVARLRQPIPSTRFSATYYSKSSAVVIWYWQNIQRRLF